MTDNDIKGRCAALRELVEQAAGSDLPPDEQRVIKLLVGAGLALLEAFLLDINRIAVAAEQIADK